MIFTVILLAICFIAAGYLVKKYIENEKRKAQDLIKSYFLPPAEGEPSQFGAMVDLVAQTFASRIVTSVRASLANVASIQERQAAGIEGDIAVDLLEQANPAIGLALNAFPSLKKRIKKNPNLVAMAANAIQGAGKKAAAAPAAPSNGHGLNQFHF